MIHNTAKLSIGYDAHKPILWSGINKKCIVEKTLRAKAQLYHDTACIKYYTIIEKMWPYNIDVSVDTIFYGVYISNFSEE